jgi:hypothetical protein
MVGWDLNPGGERQGRGTAMTSWFVSTTRKIGAEIDWRLTECVDEEEAKAHASGALSRGCRVEAGTAPGVRPVRRIGWCAAHDWAQSSSDGSIMSLYRRLGEFAA